MKICLMKCKLPGNEIKTVDCGKEDKGALEAIWMLSFPMERGMPRGGRTGSETPRGRGVRVFLSQRGK